MMRVAIKPVNGNLVINGSINFATALELKQQGAQWIAAEKKVIFDFQGVDQCDSAALAVMTGWLRYAKQLNKLIYFRHVPSSLQIIAQAYGVAEILGMRKDYG